MSKRPKVIINETWCINYRNTSNLNQEKRYVAKQHDD